MNMNPEERPVNIFQGEVPYKDLKEDDYCCVASVKSFAPNASRLYDMEAMYGNGVTISTSRIPIVIVRS